MRILSLAVSLAALTGCISGNWSHVGDLSAQCEAGTELSYFADRDGDGWGEPFVDDGTTQSSAPSVARCTPGEAATELAAILGVEEISVAPNNRDCFDADPVSEPFAPEITGRIGSICPEQLVPSDDEVYFTPFSSGGKEIVAVHDSPDGQRVTPLVWGDLAADACGVYGWGGGTTHAVGADEVDVAGSLFTLVDQPGAALDALTEALIDSLVLDTQGDGRWSGYVGVVNQDLAGQSTAGWYWETVDAEGAVIHTPVAQVATPALTDCNGALPDSGEYSRLALVRQDGGWCLGLPSDGLRVQGQYETRLGHFVCERAIPNPEDWTGTSDYGFSDSE